jgi:hypothetical protein
MKHQTSQKLFTSISINIIMVAIMIPTHLAARSIYRPSARELPAISTRWIDGGETYMLRHPNLELGPLFKHYKPDYLKQHALPIDAIPARLPHGTPIPGAQIHQLLEDLITALQQNTRHAFTHPEFTVLKNRDYNPRTQSGNIIVKFKKYPLVAKIFMETPPSFVSPFSKGFEPSVFFMMGGGVNRYLSGLGRIENAEYIRQAIQAHPHLKATCDVPRKWIWFPRQQRFFTLQSHNLGSCDQVITLPSVYVIVCDAIESNESFNILNKKHRTCALEFSHCVGIRVDPHISNFMVEQETGLIVIVDTEPFTVMVGLREELKFDNYFEWYTKLSCKGFVDCFGRTKDKRLQLQHADSSSILFCG